MRVRVSPSAPTLLSRPHRRRQRVSLLLALAAVLATLLLTLDLALGWGASLGWVSAPTHINLSFVAAIGVLFSQAMLLFYVVGSARRVRQVAREKKLPSDIPARDFLLHARCCPWPRWPCWR